MSDRYDRHDDIPKPPMTNERDARDPGGDRALARLVKAVDGLSNDPNETEMVFARAAVESARARVQSILTTAGREDG